MITGKELAEKLYSENYEDERLYSTGDSDLDDLLERAFCEGYEYAQKEYTKLNELVGKVKGKVQQAVTQHERNHAAKVIRATRKNAQDSGVIQSLPGKLGKEARETHSAIRDQVASAQALLPKKGASIKDMKINRSNLGVMKTHDATKDFFSGKKPFKK